MRPVFKDPVLQDQFSQDGFVVVPFLSDSEVHSLNHHYDQLPLRSSRGFFSGIYTADRDFKLQSNKLLQLLADDFSAEYFQDYRMLTGNFVLKHPDADSAMPCHQDWTFVDEDRYASVNIWCALGPTTFDNGALHLVPGSHKLPPNLRGTNVPNSLAGVEPITYSQMTCLEINAGHAIIHDHRILHSSPANTSALRRLATAICMIPIEATPKHCFLNPDTKQLEIYTIDTEFFYDYTYGDVKIPASATKIHTLSDFVQYQFTPDELIKLLR